MLPNLQVDSTNVFSWSYPDSWEKPCSFYGLNFQVRVVRHKLPCNSDDPILVSDTGGTNILVLSFSRLGLCSCR